MFQIRNIFIQLILIVVLAACSRDKVVLQPPENHPAENQSVDQTAPSSNAPPLTSTHLITIESTAAPQAGSAPLSRYQGPNFYNTKPDFAILYDAAIWQYVEPVVLVSEPALLHRSIQGCQLKLHFLQTAGELIAEKQLAGYSWAIISMRSDVLYYYMPYKNIGFSFGLFLGGDYIPGAQNLCQMAAEKVIRTFVIIDD